MSIESVNHSNEELQEAFKEDNENISCKDGFCYIRNVEEKKIISEKNINIFDPI